MLTRYRVTHRTGRVVEYVRWGAVVNAYRPGSVVERRVRDQWVQMALHFGLARRRK